MKSNKCVIIIMLFVFGFPILCLSQHNYKIELNIGAEINNLNRFANERSDYLLQFHTDKPLSTSFLIEGKFLFLNKRKFIHGLSLSYVSTNSDLNGLNDFYLQQRKDQRNVPIENFLPDTVFKLRNYHQLTFMYGFGFETIAKDKHVFSLLASLGAIIKKLPYQKGVYSSLRTAYSRRGVSYGLSTQINFSYSYLLDSYNGIQISASLNPNIYFSTNYKIIRSNSIVDEFVYPSYFQNVYHVKLGYTRYF